MTIFIFFSVACLARYLLFRVYLILTCIFCFILPLRILTWSFLRHCLHFFADSSVCSGAGYSILYLPVMHCFSCYLPAVPVGMGVVGRGGTYLSRCGSPALSALRSSWRLLLPLQCVSLPWGSSSFSRLLGSSFFSSVPFLGGGPVAGWGACAGRGGVFLSRLGASADAIIFRVANDAEACPPCGGAAFRVGWGGRVGLGGFGLGFGGLVPLGGTHTGYLRWVVRLRFRGGWVFGGSCFLADQFPLLPALLIAPEYICWGKNTRSEYVGTYSDYCTGVLPSGCGGERVRPVSLCVYCVLGRLIALA